LLLSVAYPHTSQEVSMEPRSCDDRLKPPILHGIGLPSAPAPNCQPAGGCHPELNMVQNAITSGITRWLPCIRPAAGVWSVHDQSAGWEVQVGWTHGSPSGWTARTGR
jgi:hypothetical protein